MEKKTLGAFIALLRKEKRLTQKQLAELLNVSDKTVSHWECDETSPDISLLPLLAQTLGVTVDELLQGEKKIIQPTVEHHYLPPKSENFSDKASSFASRTVNKIKSKMSGDISEKYRYFRILSLIGTIIACVSLSSITTANFIAGYYFLDEMSFIPGIVAFIGSLWTLAISLGFTLGARFAFSKDMCPASEVSAEEKKYIYKANTVSFNNIFLVFCSLPMALTGIDALDISVFLNVPLAIIFLAVLWLVLIATLNKKGILHTEKKKILTIKYISIFTLSAIVVSGSLLIFKEAWHPTPENIIFDNSSDFIAYMETPKNKPDNAYLVEGVSASTHPATIMMTTAEEHNANDSPVQTVPPSEQQEEVGETVLGLCGKEWITFKWLNQEVSDCAYSEQEGTFHVITYEAEIKAKDMRILADDGVPIAIVIFCIADALICFTLYRKRTNELTER